MWRFASVVVQSGMLLMAISSQLAAQLRIVEVMVDSVDDTNWEWIEVQNIGQAPVNLNGYVFDDDDGSALSQANISSTDTTNTLIPANGVAVLYNGSNLGFNDQRFRDPWKLSAGVPVIGVSNFSGLNNGGDAFGLWPSLDAYLKDVRDVDGDGDAGVFQYTNAAARLDFNTGFPATPSGASIHWTGQGDSLQGANWRTSAEGVSNAVKSIPTFLSSNQINSTDDIANPGVVPAGTAPAGLSITEVMYNPASDDDSWEWIEILNNTAADIDFSVTPYTLDDPGGDPLSGPNITSGTIEKGTVAILFDDGISEQNAKDAWGSDKNFIPVADFSALSNSGDSVGIWDNFNTYNADKANDRFTGAVESLVFSDDTAAGWPADNGAGSIYLSNLSADPSNGSNWRLSQPADGISFSAKPVVQQQVPDHPGGDIGSPGIAPGVVGNQGDFDGDSDLDAADIDALTQAVSSGSTDLKYDLNGDSTLTGVDRQVWVEQLKRTYFGDSNLDGVFGSGDLVAIFQAGQYEDSIVGNSTWATGDWNGDGEFSTGDLVFAFQSGGYEKGPRAAVTSVPEPASIALLVLGFLVAGRRLAPTRRYKQDVRASRCQV
jgi:hypothetical protein